MLVIVNIDVGIVGQVNADITVEAPVNVSDDLEILIGPPDGDNQLLGLHLVPRVDPVNQRTLVSLQLQTLQVFALSGGSLELPGTFLSEAHINTVDDKNTKTVSELRHQLRQLLNISRSSSLSLSVQDQFPQPRAVLLDDLKEAVSKPEM